MANCQGMEIWIRWKFATSTKMLTEHDVVKRRSQQLVVLSTTQPVAMDLHC
jgi:hypothetical protein